MKKYFKNLFAIIKILLKIKVNKGADLREGNNTPAEKYSDHQREFSGQGLLFYKPQGIFPTDQNSADYKQQKEQDQVGGVQQGRLEQIDRLFDQVKLRNIKLDCNLCQISGRTEGEKIAEHGKGIRHAVAAEKEQGQVEKGKGEVLEINIDEAFKEIKLMDLKLPRRAIVGIIHRNNRVIIPKGDTLIRPEDKLIIFTTKESAPVIKDFFKGS